MDKKHYTGEQIADFLQQAKEGVPNKILCEKYEFSASSLRRWKESHEALIRCELKSMESTAVKFFFGILVVSLIITSVISKAAGAFFVPVLFGYCIYYIICFRKTCEKFIAKENIFLSRSGRGAINTFYQFSWLFVILSFLAVLYVMTHSIF